MSMIDIKFVSLQMSLTIVMYNRLLNSCRSLIKVSLNFLIIFLVPFSVFCQDPSDGVEFTKLPLNKQLIPRDTVTDNGTVIVEGTYDRSGFDDADPIHFDYEYFVLEVYTSSGIYDSYQSPDLEYTNDKAPFDLTIDIKSELINYAIKIKGKIRDGVEQYIKIDPNDSNGEYEITEIVAGDVYVISGQSNAVASKYGNSSNPDLDSFIRSYSSADIYESNIKNNDRWYEAEGDGSNFSDGHVGQWGLKLGKLIVNATNTPVAIINGARDGRKISYFKKDNTSVPSSEAGSWTNNYLRLLYRLNQAGLTNKVRAIFWSQGENPGNFNNYFRIFESIRSAWRQDISPNIQIYIFQSRNGCETNFHPINFNKENQRRLAVAYDDIDIMSTDGLDQIFQPSKNYYCHFNYAGGYEVFADRIFPLINKRFYGATYNSEIKPPNITAAYLTSETTLVIETDANGDLILNDGDEMNFEIRDQWNGGYDQPDDIPAILATVTDVMVDKNKIILSLSNYPGSNFTVSNVGNIPGNSDQLITNANGLELLNFYIYDVDQSRFTVWKGSNWTNGTPNQSLYAVIESDYQNSSIDLVTKGLTIGSGANLNFDSSGSSSVIVHGNLSIFGDMIIGDTESLLVKDVDAEIFIDNNGSFIKKEKSSLLKSNFDVTYWGSPVEGEAIENVFLNVDPNRIFDYRPLDANPIYTGNYEKYRHWFVASGSMLPGKGYAADGVSGSNYPRRSEMEFTGLPNYKDIAIMINKFSSGSESYDKTNLLSNPYPAAIDANALIDENLSVFKGTIYVWTHAQDYESGEYSYDYLTYNKMGASGSDIDDPYFIASGQGFMILTEESSATFNFRNSMMVSGQNNVFYKKRTKQNGLEKLDQNRIWLNLSGDNNEKKELLIGFDENASKGIDVGYDGKFINTGGSLAFYSLIKKDKYAIQALGSSIPKQKRNVSLGYTTSKKGTYSIGISRLEGEISNHKIYLIDRDMRVTHDLKVSDYIFQQDTDGDFDNRFSIRFEDLRTNKDSKKNQSVKVKLRIDQNSLFIDTELKVRSLQGYDIMGRLVVQGRPKNNVLDMSGFSIHQRSLLFIQMVLEDGTIIKKKIFKIH